VGMELAFKVMEVHGKMEIEDMDTNRRHGRRNNTTIQVILILINNFSMG